MKEITHTPLTPDDREQFITDNQEAFNHGVLHEFSKSRQGDGSVVCLGRANRTGEPSLRLSLIRKSGLSSFMYLQNVYASSLPMQQAMAVTIAMCGEILGERGAYRVHGGGMHPC